MSDGYDYGPPVTTDGETGTPAQTTGVLVAIPGGSPFSPPPDAATIIEPGGSPSDAWLALNDPNITSLTPDTAAISEGDATVTVNGTNFDSDSVVEVDQVAVSTTYVSATELTATFVAPGEAGTVSVTVRNPTGEQESNATTFTWT